MDESFSVKAEKKKIKSEVNLCIICLTKKPKEIVIKEPKFYRVLPWTYFQFHEKDRYGDPGVADFVSRMKEQTYINLTKNI